MLDMLKVGMYLRKSREDERLENELGKGETLALHRRDLIKYARDNGLNILKVYEEVESGDSLLYRVAMLELLKDVEEGKYDGVLVMDMQRLGRGDLEEQGLILKTFKKSGTKIITPNKTYDLDDEFDEEYSEFEAFMSRKEYKMINKRLRRGAMRSVEDGNYNAPNRPFGYKIKKIKNGRTLEIKNDEAEIVKMIYNWYTEEVVGSQKIADRLNSMGIKTTRGNKWSSQSIAAIVKNPLYCGKIAYNRTYGYRSGNKKKATKNRDRDEWLIVDGKHEGIISKGLYERAYNIMANYRKSPAKPRRQLNNALAGLVVCGVCGAKMVYRPYSNPNVLPHLMCRQKCGNKSAKFVHIEKAVLKEVENILYSLKIQQNKNEQVADEYKSNIENQIALLARQKDDTIKQREKAYDFLERDIYSIEVFTERSKILHERLNAIETEIKNKKDELNQYEINSNTKLKIKTIESILEIYNQSTTDQKNLMLKSIIEKVVYFKDKKAREDNFEIQVYSRFTDMSML